MSAQPLNGAMIAALSAAAIPVVTMLVNLLKPFVEKLPWADPSNPADKATHDATLQMLNGVVTIGATLGIATAMGYISDPASFWALGVQIIGVLLGADFNYRASAKSSNGGVLASGAPSANLVANALNTAITSGKQVNIQTQIAPLAASSGMPNAVKQLADDAQPVTAKMPAVKPAASPTSAS